MAVEVYLPQKPRAGLALPLSALDHNNIPKPPASYTEHTPARSEQLRYPQPWEGLVSHHTARKWTSYQWSGERQTREKALSVPTGPARPNLTHPAEPQTKPTPNEASLKHAWQGPPHALHTHST